MSRSAGRHRLHRPRRARGGRSLAAILHRRRADPHRPRDPQAQGYPRESFDIVLGYNVVHATPHIEETVGHLRNLLAPGGLLVIRTAALDALRSRHSEFVNERQRYTRRQLMAAMAT